MLTVALSATPPLHAMMSAAAATTAATGRVMNWNAQPIPYAVALRIGWNLPADVVGAGVYGGIVKRDAKGAVVLGDEWPEDNLAPPAHNPVHTTGPFLDYAKFTPANRGYTAIALAIMAGDGAGLEAMLSAAGDGASKLANLVMTGGARPLHMCGMGRGGDTSGLIETLIKYGADVNAKDNYEMTPMERLSSNAVRGNAVLRRHGGVVGRRLPGGAPKWAHAEFAYVGPLGETHDTIQTPKE